jgi:Copper type II ascorbate-dependent monooxygenase, C-terminal domain
MSTESGTIQSRQGRWWRAVRSAHSIRDRKVRRRLALVVLVVTPLAVAGAVTMRWLQEAPKSEPSFEAIADERAGPVRDFALRDASGALHTMDEWSGRRAIVLLFYKVADPKSSSAGRAMAKLAALFEPRGFLFLAVCCEPASGQEGARGRSVELDCACPIVFDPRQIVARQAGIRAVPEAVMLAPDGQVLYRGRLLPPPEPGLYQGPAARYHLESAVRSIDRDELPAVCSTPSDGSPFPSPPPADDLPYPDPPITFSRHVAPILWKHCVCCHRPGEVGPFSLLSYQDAAKRADFLYEVTDLDRMPPWKPHPGAGVFLDAPRLSFLEKETLKRWALTGCEPGEPGELPAPPAFRDGWQLGEPDLVLSMPEPIEVSADGPDTYQTVPLRVPPDRDLIAAGFEFRPGNRRVVHHSRIHLDVEGAARRLQERGESASRRIGEVDPRSVELPYPGLGAWTPGMTPRLAPDGVGRLIPRGSDVVLQIHYHPTGKLERDRSRLGIFLAKKPIAKTMAGYSLCTDQIDIPAGAKRHKIILSTRIKADLHLYSAVPHAHDVCREFRLAATRPDGTVQPLLWIKDWSLDWQDQYTYLKPVRLPKGTVITLAAYYDNSAENPRNPNRPPARVRYGLSTKDEMCACHLEFLPDDASGYEAYPFKSPFGL